MARLLFWDPIGNKPAHVAGLLWAILALQLLVLWCACRSSLGWHCDMCYLLKVYFYIRVLCYIVYVVMPNKN